METFAEPFSKLVGKKSGDGESWLPLFAHLLDTAGVMKHLYQRWLPKNIINTIFQENPDIDSEILEKVCVFCALSHDIGKGTPVFQAMICNNTSSSIKDRFADIGLSLMDFSGFIDRWKTPHAAAGEGILLRYGCPAGIAAVVGAHHGKPISGLCKPGKLLDHYEENFYGEEGESSEEGALWKGLRRFLVDFALRYSGFHDISDLPDISCVCQMLVCGLLIVADWIASNENYAPLISSESDGSEIKYPDRSDKIWNALSFPDPWIASRKTKNDGQFYQYYGFYPNAMQKCVIEAVSSSTSPGIYIIEAPMGQGKTEAALAAAEILAGTWGCEGLFFGLPTQATANGVFPRIESWAERQSDGMRLSIKLAHQRAAMLEEYRKLFTGHATQNEDAPETASLLVHPWFEGRKQSLLSSFEIGTVDQLLMAALKQKHVMLRHLGLAGKVVVIDECHAYDTYMNTFLDRALAWLGVYHVPVILLSATLPSKRREELVRAYHSDPFIEEPEGWGENMSYPLITYSSGDRLYQKTVQTVKRNLTVKITRGHIEDVTNLLKEKLSDGGCAGVIMNTVYSAQKMAAEIKDKMPEYEVVLVHSRFTAADRQEIESVLMQRIGKHSKPEERNLIAVGTQVLEQSLDIDFDFLITQAAPMDLLLQRIGRLHRHSGRSRPTLLRDAECVVCDCDDPDEGSRAIYNDWILLRTAAILPDAIHIPEDISPLVQEAYRDLDEGDSLYVLKKEQDELQRQKMTRAMVHCIPRDTALHGNIHSLIDCGVEDDENRALACVRDTQESIEVLLLIDNGDGTVSCPKKVGLEKIARDHCPSNDECYKILAQRVRLPNAVTKGKLKECAQLLEKESSTRLSAWEGAKLLKGEYIMILNREMSRELFGYTLKYDTKAGLSCGKGDL